MHICVCMRTYFYHMWLSLVYQNGPPYGQILAPSLVTAPRSLQSHTENTPPTGTDGCLLDLDVLPLARLPATMVVSFRQGAGVHAGEHVHSQVEELVEAELCLHATAAPSRATKRASSRSPVGHRRSTQARRLHWPYDTPFNHAVLVMGYDVRRREN